MQTSNRASDITRLMVNHINPKTGQVVADVRIALLDLLHGRVIRASAQRNFEYACYFEVPYKEASDEALDRAVHWEWIARITELGRVAWGDRLNRCGWHDKPDEE